MYLLIDECCGKSLVGVAEAAGHRAQRTVEVAALGRGAADVDIFAFARRHDAVLVTINQGDFVSLATRVSDHPGLILLPSVRGQTLGRMLRIALRAGGETSADRSHHSRR